jgi:hypothetical protein
MAARGGRPSASLDILLPQCKGLTIGPTAATGRVIAEVIVVRRALRGLGSAFAESRDIE